MIRITFVRNENHGPDAPENATIRSAHGAAQGSANKIVAPNPAKRTDRHVLPRGSAVGLHAGLAAQRDSGSQASRTSIESREALSLTATTKEQLRAEEESICINYRLRVINELSQVTSLVSTRINFWKDQTKTNENASSVAPGQTVSENESQEPAAELDDTPLGKLDRHIQFRNRELFNMVENHFNDCMMHDTNQNRHQSMPETDRSTSVESFTLFFKELKSTSDVIIRQLKDEESRQLDDVKIKYRARSIPGPIAGCGLDLDAVSRAPGSLQGTSLPRSSPTVSIADDISAYSDGDSGSEYSMQSDHEVESNANAPISRHVSSLTNLKTDEAKDGENNETRAVKISVIRHAGDTFVPAAESRSEIDQTRSTSLLNSTAGAVRPGQRSSSPVKAARVSIEANKKAGDKIAKITFIRPSHNKDFNAMDQASGTMNNIVPTRPSTLKPSLSTLAAGRLHDNPSASVAAIPVAKADRESAGTDSIVDPIDVGDLGHRVTVLPSVPSRPVYPPRSSSLTASRREAVSPRENPTLLAAERQALPASPDHAASIVSDNASVVDAESMSSQASEAASKMKKAFRRVKNMFPFGRSGQLAQGSASQPSLMHRPASDQTRRSMRQPTATPLKEPVPDQRYVSTVEYLKQKSSAALLPRRHSAPDVLATLKKDEGAPQLPQFDFETDPESLTRWSESTLRSTLSVMKNPSNDDQDRS